MLPSERFEYLKNKYNYREDWVKNKLKFFKDYGIHVKGVKAGQPFIPNEWELDNIIKPIFGLENNGFRLISKAYIQTPKKTGKSILMANIEVGVLYTEAIDYGAAEIYNCAGDDEQANLLFSMAVGIVNKSKDLLELSRVLSHTGWIYHEDAYIRRINSSGMTKQGMHPLLVIYDEIQAAKDRDLYDTIDKAFGQTPNNLFIMCTNPGTDKDTICHQQYSYATKVKKEIIEDNNYWYVLLEEYPKDDEDIYSEELLKKVNPLYISTPSLQTKIKSEIREAINDPVNENSFRRYRLGQWTQSETRWMNTDVIEACYNPDLAEEDYHGEQCYLGLDFASTQDMVGYTNLILTENTYKWFCRLWIPEKAATKYEKKYNIPYSQWEKEGWVTLVPGNIISFEEDVEPVIKENIGHFAVRSMGYDQSYGATQMALRLQNNLGLEVNKVIQGFKMHPGIDKMSELFKDKRIGFNNPVLKWQFDNVLLMVGNYDAKTRLVKPQDEKKIDGIVSGVMAVYESMIRDPEEEEQNIMVW